jgi:hypothetical protein
MRSAATNVPVVTGELFPETAARVEAWAADPGVLGVLLVGSKSRGHQDARSDDDLEVLLTGEAFARLSTAECHAYRVEGEGPARRLVYDAQLTSLADLERKRDSAADLDHWPYERARRRSGARGWPTRRWTAGSPRAARSRPASADSTPRWRCWSTAGRGR